MHTVQRIVLLVTKLKMNNPCHRSSSTILIFVAVRAIAPVAGIPPNNGVIIFATPCATNSIFDRCLPPIIPSATTAESKDSIAARIAIVVAGPIKFLIIAKSISGKTGEGSADGSSPNFDPIVSTGK